MRRLMLGALAIIALTLTACEDKTPAMSEQAGMSSFMVTTKTGRTIECVSWEAYQKGGLSCDWGAK